MRHFRGIVGDYEKETSKGTEKDYGLCWFSPIAKSFPRIPAMMISVLSEPTATQDRTSVMTLWRLSAHLLWRLSRERLKLWAGTGTAVGESESFCRQKTLLVLCPPKTEPSVCRKLKRGRQGLCRRCNRLCGRTGYSDTENTNGITESHLHLGLELVFDESQKESNNEIWIDVGAITSVVEQNQSEVVRNNETKEFTRKYKFTVGND